MNMKLPIGLEMEKPQIVTPPGIRDGNQGIDLVHSYYHPPGVKGLVQRMLGKDVPLIRSEVMAAAFEKNPYSGVMAADSDGSCIGFFGAWSIEDRKLMAILRGDIRDEE